jgi:hypothetical protein
MLLFRRELSGRRCASGSLSDPNNSWRIAVPLVPEQLQSRAARKIRSINVSDV